jgi:hypothetical protein
MGARERSWFGRVGMAVVAAGALALGACAAPQGDDVASNAGAITDVHETSVKKQVIGNCWLYSVTGWAEALHKGATGKTINLSESYLSYWYWFDQLTKPGECGIKSVTEGGTWETARDLVARYGMMREADFVPEEADAESSARQDEALASLNAALASKGSPIQKAIATGDRAAVRAELTKIWKLDEKVAAELTAVFGADGSKTLDKNRPSPAPARVIAPSDLAVRIPVDSGAVETRTLADAVSGRRAWTEVQAPGWTGDDSIEARRSYERRIQRALHDGQPVLISWWVDTDALDNRGNFTTRQSGEPSKDGGGHMSIITDYQVSNVPGFGTLEAGKVETRAEALEAALSQSATIEFFRIKNSWGSAPDAWKDRAAADRAAGGPPGYNDLYTGYLFDLRAVSVDTSMLVAPEAAAPGADPCASTGGPTGEYLIAGLYPMLGAVLPAGY